MGEATDFLIRYDLARSKRARDALLAEEFDCPETRQLFCRIVRDPLARAMFELEYNGSIRFEDFRPLRKAGLVIEVLSFYPRVSYGDESLEPIRYVVQTPIGQRWLPDDLKEGRIDPHRFFVPYIEGYLWRSTKGGIVASADALTDALAIPDVEVLSLIRDPITGRRYMQDDNPDAWEAMLRLTPPEDIHAARRSQLKWWTIEDRSTVLHDMSGRKPGREPWGRNGP